MTWTPETAADRSPLIARFTASPRLASGQPDLPFGRASLPVQG